VTRPGEHSNPIPTPANIAPLVDALGVGMAARFLIRFGGTELKLPMHSFNRNSAVLELVGPDRAQRLIENAHLVPRRIPLANEWVAKQLLLRGRGTNEIARLLRITDQTVREYRAHIAQHLPAVAVRTRLPDPYQPDLFDQ